MKNYFEFNSLYSIPLNEKTYLPYLYIIPLNENKQQTIKRYGDVFDEEDMDNILAISGGDAYTKFVADMYYYAAGYYNLEMVIPKKPNQNELNYLEEGYELMREYKGNIFPIKTEDEFKRKVHPLEFRSDLATRKRIIDKLKEMPSVYLRNLREDMRVERGHYEMENLLNTVRSIASSVELLERTNPEHKDKIFKKIFTSEINTFREVEQRLNDTQIPYLNEESEREEIIDKINSISDAEIVHNENSVLAVLVKSYEAMHEIGCSSQWCFVRNPSDWDSGTYGNYATVVFNFDEDPSDPKRMVVILEGGEVYDMYNDYLEDGDSYLYEIGVHHLTERELVS